MVRTIQANATSLGLIGGGFLLWSSLSLFSVLESAFNIVYDRPNRPFLHGKALARRLHAGLARHPVRGPRRSEALGVAAAEPLRAGVPRTTGRRVRCSRCRLAVGVFVVPRLRLPLPDERRPRAAARCCPARSSPTVALEATFQVLPLYIGLVEARARCAGLRRPGAAPDLALRDGERDRVRGRGQLASSAAVRAAAARARCEFRRFQAFPSSATVRSSPSGTKIGS